MIKYFRNLLEVLKAQENETATLRVEVCELRADLKKNREKDEELRRLMLNYYGNHQPQNPRYR